MWGELVEDVLRRLDAEEKLSGAVSSLVLASLLGEIEECLGGQPPERPSPDVIQSAEPVRAYIDSIEAQGFRGIGPRTKLSLTPGPGLTLVVGRNGSGKSSFAEALELLLTGDNQRWSSRRTKIWREGWRNLHTSEGTRLEARLLIDGEAGPYVVSRTWGADEDLDDGEASVVHDTKSSPLSELEKILKESPQDPLRSGGSHGNMAPMGLVFVDCEAYGGCPALGALTEIGAVTYPDRRTFHGILVPTRPRKDNPAIPEPAGPPFDGADVFRRFDVWLKENTPGRPVMVSDNPAFDFQ